ncbi:hypothetical protein Ddye_018662 [Dipteronia dyeriana]|uniref:Aminotransferase class I/classII large domain-containing protein n=1 Tax=Dipteronia dyeriana TaxID=168575 RepID=A0AAD9UBN0_9ROSI|nr:hypothetical protein Ddye_018662 [Dipteronia dyeriana]
MDMVHKPWPMEQSSPVVSCVVDRSTCGFRNEELAYASSISTTIQGVLSSLKQNLNQNDTRPTLPVGKGDPSAFPSFIVDVVRSSMYSSYAPTIGIFLARRVIADYLNHDLPYKLTPYDVYLTPGCTQAIKIILTVLTRPGANILLLRPGFPLFEACTACNRVEIRHLIFFQKRVGRLILMQWKLLQTKYFCHGYHQSLWKCLHLPKFAQGI